ncbi:MAG: endopeptidase La [Calditrichia bacterium]
MAEQKKRTRKKFLPLVPLKDFVMFPHTLYPLLVGRERSLNAVERAYQKKEKLIMSLEIEINEKNGILEIQRIGTIGKIIHFLRLPNGLIKALVEGTDRVVIDKVKVKDNYFVASFSPFEVENDFDEAANIWVGHLKSVFKKYIEYHQDLPEEIFYHLDALGDPDKIIDFVALHIDTDIEKKQEILEAVSLKKRLELAVVMANEALAAIEVEKEIENKVKENLMESQRKMILQEQMKIIQEELDEEEDVAEDELWNKINSNKLPKDVKTKAIKEYKRLQMMPPYAPEASVIRNYLDWLLELPWDKKTKDQLNIQNVRKILDEDHYALTKVKNRILEHLAVLKKNRKKTQGTILCFAGPPGVGKTSLASSIARALGRKFVRVSLGGVRDEAEIRGHRRTYVGALPGRIIQGLKKAGTKNPVFLLDEIDKLSMDFRGDPSAALLEALDPEQNKTFGDHFIEVDVDLSEVFFIMTANDKNLIPWALRDRMEIIDIPGYLDIEKTEIAKRHLIPKLLSNAGLKDEEIVFTDNALLHIIRNYTREAGVRNLERLINTMIRKILVQYFEKKINLPLFINESEVKKFLGAPKFSDLKLAKIPEPGVVNGLAWTPTGGDIIKIEVVVLPGKGKIHLTGKLGEVMKESAEIAITYVKSLLEKINLPTDYLSKKDIHLHIPEGAVPKDGPSAGTAITTAVISRLMGLAVPSSLAMTGEITLQGHVLPIGGLPEKMMAARRYGIQKVFLPSENRSDWEELDSYLKKDMDIRFVDDYLSIYTEIFQLK